MKTKAHPVGTIVRSHYRAHWVGVVVASGADHNFEPRAGGYQAVPVTRDNKRLELKYVMGKGWEAAEPFYWLGQPSNVVVKVTHDRCGDPLRKPLWKTLDSGWLEAQA